ncbi:MAG: cell surface protein [Polyangiaceae bacterium]
MAVATVLLACGCGSQASSSDRGQGGGPMDAAAGGPLAWDAAWPVWSGDASDSLDSSRAVRVDGSYLVGPAEAGVSIAADRFVTGVVSFDPGVCAGFGAASMPAIVEGPPAGGGSSRGSTDVVSLGTGGSIVVSFAPNAIVDGPGADFIVFENPFWVGGNPNDIYAEPGEVSVSDDGATWHTFPCAPAIDPASAHGTGVAPPYGACAGWHIVNSSPANGVSPIDPSVAGGDAFDLAAIGVTRARYVRIVDKTREDCPDAGGGPNTNGFDLDAVSIVNAESP